MRALLRCSLVVACLVAATASASTLTFGVPAHEVRIDHDGHRQNLFVVLTKERLEANVVVDVYSLASAPGSERHLKELRAMPRKDWWKEIAWDVRDANGRPLRIAPRLLDNRVTSKRGSNWRTRPASLKTYSASFDLGQLQPGDYTVAISIRGLSSAKLSIAIRKGDEPDVRDHARELAAKRR